MKISVEISLYPIANDDYKNVILDFISDIKSNTALEVITNGMSTQIFGEYEDVMSALTTEIKLVLEAGQALAVIKIGKGILKL